MLPHRYFFHVENLIICDRAYEHVTRSYRAQLISIFNVIVDNEYREIYIHITRNYNLFTEKYNSTAENKRNDQFTFLILRTLYSEE